MSNEQIVEKDLGEGPQKFKVVEHVIDSNNVKRYLVPIDRSEDDVPTGATLLDENESKGLIARQGRLEKIVAGDLVRLKSGKSEQRGNVESVFKSGKLRVRWEDGSADNYLAKDLQKVY